MNIAGYLGSLVTLIILDVLWLGFIAKSFYKSQLGTLMLEQPRVIVAFIFYALYAAGITYFAVSAGLRDKLLMSAILNGAILGFIAYMTYDLSNYSTIRGFPALVIPVDIIWGMFVSAVSAAVGYMSASRNFS